MREPFLLQIFGKYKNTINPWGWWMPALPTRKVKGLRKPEALWKSVCKPLIDYSMMVSITR